jgi:hypothetical protein
MPRTGTTLVAELLGQHPAVRNRGETAWIPYIVQQLGMHAGSAAALHEAAALYRRQLRQDDAPAQFYVDKNPLNFRHLDLIARMLPEARIVRCARAPADTALSLWGQYFDSEDCNFAYDFSHIAAAMSGEAGLMRQFERSQALPLFTVDYESLVAQPAEMLARLHAFLQLPAVTQGQVPEPAAALPITTASAWQARQPVHRNATGRWRHYEELIPELRGFAEGLPPG